MDSEFKDRINLTDSHPSVFGHFYSFPIENLVFKLLDQIASKLSQKII